MYNTPFSLLLSTLPSCHRVVVIVVWVSLGMMRTKWCFEKVVVGVVERRTERLLPVLILGASLVDPQALKAPYILLHQCELHQFTFGIRVTQLPLIFAQADLSSPWTVGPEELAGRKGHLVW